MAAWVEQRPVLLTYPARYSRSVAFRSCKSKRNRMDSSESMAIPSVGPEHAVGPEQVDGTSICGSWLDGLTMDGLTMNGLTIGSSNQE